MHPVIIALFTGMGNIFRMAQSNNALLQLILLFVMYFFLKDVVKGLWWAKKKGWFEKSVYDMVYEDYAKTYENKTDYE